MPRRPSPPSSPGDYGRLLSAIKIRVRAAQVRAGFAANRVLLSLYWDIGRMILGRQRAQGWGAKVIDRPSRDLQNEFPGQQGFSPRNLKYMRAFAEAWPDSIVHRPGAQLGKGAVPMVQAPLAQSTRNEPAIVQQPVAQLPWKHHCLLLDSFRQPGDKPSIGLILCRASNRIVAEYALRDMTKPIGVSGYVTRLVATLPKLMREAIPRVKEIETGLSSSRPKRKRSKSQPRMNANER